MNTLKIYRDYGAVSLSKIAAAETQLNCVFPVTYKKLISSYDALWLENRDFDFQFEGDTTNRDVVFFGFGDNLTQSQRIINAQEEEYCHSNIVIIGESCNGDFICFDYRNDLTTNNPPVVVMFHDYPDDDDDGKLMVAPVAESFELFINLLYKSNDNN